MFTGIIEETGDIKAFTPEYGGARLVVRCQKILDDISIGDSIAINGCCQTVVKFDDTSFTVQVSKETLNVTTFKKFKAGSKVNLERALTPLSRMGGHIVQGHVDQTATCTAITEADGSWYYTFEYDASTGNVTVEKGSIAVNGVSLTVVNSREGSFQVAIIPYTYEHTNFHTFKVGTVVNLEFDIVGKYIAKLMKQYLK